MIKLSSEFKSLLAAVQSVKGNMCFTELFLLKMGCEISGWRFLEFCFFLYGFLLYYGFCKCDSSPCINYVQYS